METLVLNVSYEPVARVSWQRAITLLWERKVEVVEEYEDYRVRSVTFELKMPSVIRFLRAVRGRKRAIKFSRENVYARDKGRCQYCRTAVPRHEFTYDHVIPRRQSGQTRWENVVVCCTPCNQRKGGRTPEDAGMKLVAQPVRPRTLPGRDALHLHLAEGHAEPVAQLAARCRVLARRARERQRVTVIRPQHAVRKQRRAAASSKTTRAESLGSLRKRTPRRNTCPRDQFWWAERFWLPS